MPILKNILKLGKPTKHKIAHFQKAILGWFDANGRKFHWRAGNLGSFELVIAEVLLQRTKAESVNRFYLSFIDRYGSWEKISGTPAAEMKRALQPLGLHKQRAVRLQKLAAEMVKRNGAFPEERGELDKIPLMGQYIANSVELLVSGIPSPLLDTSMARVLERVFKPRVMADIRYDPLLQKTAQMVVNHPKSKYINWAILDLAAIVCLPRNQRCEVCPLNFICNYFRTRKI